MIIDDATFTDLAVHLRQASSKLLLAARGLADLCDPSQQPKSAEAELHQALEQLTDMNEELVVLEGILRAVWEINREEAPALS